MEVKLDKRYPVAATVEQAWTVLADVRATAACMPGAQITEQIDATHFKGTLKSKIGPAMMSFGGDIELLALDAATRTLKMMGKGADKAGSSAQMTLEARVEPGEAAGQCVLLGQATVLVSGKLAQFGSRLLVPVSDAMLSQFADNFRAVATAVPVAAPVPAAPAARPAGVEALAAVPAAAGDVAAAPAQPAAAPPAMPVSMAAPAPLPAPPVRELNALSLLWAVIKGWFAGLFGRRS